MLICKENMTEKFFEKFLSFDFQAIFVQKVKEQKINWLKFLHDQKVWENEGNV